jgi:DNA modification methylase
MKIEKIPTDKLIPYARNAKKHDASQVSKLAGSIREFGFNNPVLIDKDNGIIAGHGRVMAAQQLNLADVPCIRLGHLTDNQRKAYILADNRLAEVNSGWDEELLKLEIADIDWGDIKGLSVDDFEFGEIDFKEDEPEASEADAEPQIDKAEELRAKWGVEPGQLWELGDHRLLCGDSTKAEDVDRVMDGERAACVVTDPPYGVAYSGQKETMRYGKNTNARVREKITGDATPEEAEAITTEALSNCTAPIAFVWCAPQFHDMAKRAALHNGYELFALIVWNKNMANFGAMGSTYKPKYEMALACKRKGGNIPFYGPDNETTVWDFDRASKNEFHPTQKPTDLFARAITNHSQPGETVFDPFLGSGTTLIAAEQLGRKCRAIEISPAYVAVALQRWADATGKTPRKF